MKKLTTLLLLISMSAIAQIEISVFQNLDLNRTDIITSVKIYNSGKRPDNWSKQIYAFPLFEYADFSDGKYLRYSAGIGYEFLHNNRATLSPSFDYGIVNKVYNDTADISMGSFQAGLDISYKILPNFKISALWVVTENPTKIDTNFFIGLQYIFSKKYKRRWLAPRFI